MTRPTTIEIINQFVNEFNARYSNANAWIEYNFDKLPRVKGITKTKFHGVPSKFNSEMNEGTARIMFRYG